MWWLALRTAPEAAAAPGPVQPLAPAPGSENVAAVLAWRCLQRTPLVAQVDGVLVMELSGSVRLFGGQAALLRRIYIENKPLAPVEYAQGATSLVAVGRLLAGSPLHAPLPPEALPLQALAAARPHAELLARMGVRTWGQLRALPRGGVVRRFGQGLLDALDRAWGDAPETYDWLQAPARFAQRVELAASVDSAPGLLFGARRLLALLLEWLRARQHGVLALELVWELDARRANLRHRDAYHQGDHCGRLLLRTAQPTQDMAHLQRLLAEHLARVQLPAPVLVLQLHSRQTAPMGGESHSLLAQVQRQGEALQPTLERLAARLGAEQVLGVQLCDAHQPEAMQHWAPHTGTLPPHPVAIKKRAVHAHSSWAGAQWGMDAAAAPAALAQAARLLPPLLLEPPSRVAPQRLRLLGPVQRLETGWLDGVPVLRDYRLAQLAGVGLVWVFRERLAARSDAETPWYLHGVWG
ncbi:DNA polymerase Y family protein [Curvibacter sp. APW13]|uniref:DNA polymerase Y family protein n=1 Tax=Curvibacter sp. APW13 TaxID=3077236 RepID=UPI0028DDC980|nr:DNA polymerase Y family protein [Curvibacter sp. APW13]MDT8989638.1 DNA polymerase Y family protein [Curvibacter sp. APW13]